MRTGSDLPLRSEGHGATLGEISFLYEIEKTTSQSWGHAVGARSSQLTACTEPTLDVSAEILGCPLPDGLRMTPRFFMVQDSSRGKPPSRN
jgi:hypothetical protein